MTVARVEPGAGAPGVQAISVSALHRANSTRQRTNVALHNRVHLPTAFSIFDTRPVTLPH